MTIEARAHSGATINSPLRCLLAEDSENDALLLLRELRAGGFEVTSERVDCADALRQALLRQPWDIVISDYRMPGFSGLEALALVKAHDNDLPFIMISGQMGEELAVEAMRSGAGDYLTKDRLARLVPAVQRELREAVGHRARARAEAALRASEAHLRLVTDYAPVLIAHCDCDRRYRFVNRAYAELFGARPEELIGKHPCEVMGAAQYAQIEAQMAAALEGRRVEFDVDFRIFGGERRALHVHYAPERAESGEVVGFVAGIIDISSRQRAEDALLASHRHLKATLDASPDLFFEVGLDGRFYDFHSPRRDLLAAPPETLIGSLVSEIMPAEAADTALAALREANEKQTSTGKQIQLTVPAGRKWFELSVARKETPADAPPRFVVVSRDISARKQSEACDVFLAEAGIDPAGEDFFAALTRFLATELDTEFVCVDRLDALAQVATTIAVWQDGHYSDNFSYALDNTPCGTLVERSICCFPADVCAHFPGNEALRALQAESYVGVSLRSHSGRAIGLVVVIGRRPLVDQARAEALLARVAPRAAAELERLTMENALRESEARFRSIFEQAPLGVALVDSGSGAILAANARFAVIVGRSLAELTTLDWMSLAPAEDIPEGLGLMARLNAGLLPAFELDKRHQRPDGSQIWIHLTIAPLIDGDGCGSRHLCMMQDINERKRAEEALRTNNAVLSQFNAIAVGRELRMVELKREINALCSQLGEAPRHRIVGPVQTLPGLL